MSYTSAVPIPTFGPTGFVVPDESAILTGIQADQNAAFQNELNPALETPQGQLASSQTAILGDNNDTFLLYTNLVDPALSSGRMQDAIARIYFLTRNAAQSTVIQVVCTGLSGTTIGLGALVVDTNQNIYACTEAGQIGSGGTVTLSFANQQTGPLPVPVSNGISIYQTIFGWDSVTCSSGVLGSVVESAPQFELRRQAHGRRQFPWSHRFHHWGSG